MSRFARNCSPGMVFWDAFEKILPEQPAFRRRRSAGPSPTGFAEFVEGQADGEPTSAGLPIPPTSTPISPATTPAMNWLSAGTTNRVATICARWGLSYVLDGENGLSLCHHVYRGNIADGEEFSTSLTRILSMLDSSQIARDTVTLVYKGSAAGQHGAATRGRGGLDLCLALESVSMPVEYSPVSAG